MDARVIRTERRSMLEAAEASGLRFIEPVLFALAFVLLGYVSWVHLESAYVYSTFERELTKLAPATAQEHPVAPPSTPRPPMVTQSPHQATTVSMPDGRGFLGVLEVPRL